MNLKPPSAAHDAPAGKLFDLRQPHAAPLRRGLMALLASPLEKNLMLTRINEVYARITNAPTPRDFFGKCLDNFNIRYTLSDADRRKIPLQGPLITVANHPFGGVEGVILAHLLLSLRPDVKILGNYLLQRMTAISGIVLAVDVFERPGSRAANAQALKEAIRWVRDGGALITFPAGEVSHLLWTRGAITDPPWNPHVGALIRHSRATVLPFYFPGKNSLLFQVMGLLHPLLRTALLPRELANKGAQTIAVYAGKPLSWKKLAQFPADRELVQYLRAGTYFLRNRVPPPRRRPALALLKRRPWTPPPIMAPVPADELREEISRLPAADCLVTAGEFNVFLAPAARLPRVLREIGRLRETTFREVREGTGQPCDLDNFDRHYLHLFLWNRAAAELAGAYRLGLTDVILPQHGVRGLYTNTLFRFKRGFLPELANAIELGRSFIVSKYQKEYNCLALLWKGVGQFIIRNPRYKILFGPVSISEDYQAVSRRLIVQFLRQNRLDAALARLVRPRRPCRRGRPAAPRGLRPLLRDIDDVSLLISEIEKDGKGIPILLRHYLRLNASFIGFNVDAKFANVVDGLVRVDLTRTDPRIMRRFMGEDGFQVFARHHGLLPDAAPVPPHRDDPPLLESVAAQPP